MKKILLVPYDPNWKKIFEKEKKLISENCTDYKEIYHVGSTSIKEMSAKPKIDIILEVNDLLTFDYSKLQKCGYQIKGEFNIPFRFYCAKNADLKINLHLFEKNDPNIEMMIKFRDYIASNKSYFEEYKNLKISISQMDDSAEKNGNVGLLNNYNLRKNSFILDIIGKLNLDEIYPRFCSHYI